MAKEIKVYTKAEMLKKFKNKFIDVYPIHGRNKETGERETTYEVRRVANKIRENCQTLEEIFEME